MRSEYFNLISVVVLNNIKNRKNRHAPPPAVGFCQLQQLMLAGPVATFAASGVAGSASVFITYPFQAVGLAGVKHNFCLSHTLTELRANSVLEHGSLARRLAVNSFWSRSVFVGSMFYCESLLGAVVVSTLQAPVTYSTRMHQIFAPIKVNPYAPIFMRSALPLWTAHTALGNALFIGGYSLVNDGEQNHWRSAFFVACAQFYMAPVDAYVTRAILKKNDPVKLSLPMLFARMFWKVPEFVLHVYFTEHLLKIIDGVQERHDSNLSP